MSGNEGGASRIAFDRRGADGGPPPGSPDRRVTPPVRFLPSINLGAVLQILTVLGSAAGAIYAAGGYVQGLRDDLRAATHAQAQGDANISGAMHELASSAALQAQSGGAAACERTR